MWSVLCGVLSLLYGVLSVVCGVLCGELSVLCGAWCCTVWLGRGRDPNTGHKLRLVFLIDADPIRGPELTAV